MSRVLLLQIDGTMPNLALMRIAAYHREFGDEVDFRFWPGTIIQPELWGEPSRVYASVIFKEHRSSVDYLLSVYPDAIVGGTGWDLSTSLEHVGVTAEGVDYSLYPDFTSSIGFTQRGCRFLCPFCVVPEKEGPMREVATIEEIWRGESHPRDIILLDNDFLGQPDWRARLDELRDGGFRVNFNQGINARTLSDESAAALASVRYYDRKFRARRLHTAWDNRRDERHVMRGLEVLIRHGVKPDHLMVLMLIGYWEGEAVEDWDYRRSLLRELGARPYPMPYIRTRETVGFQRWVVGAYDKRISWQDWTAAGHEPRRLGRKTPQQDQAAEVSHG